MHRLPVLLITFAVLAGGCGDDSTDTSLRAPESDRPATFLAVTEDFQAVEVDTLTGDVVRIIGGIATRIDPTSEEPTLVVDSVWRTVDGSQILLSECCEPAAGVIHYLGPTEVLTSENHAEKAYTPGWFAVPSPVTSEVAIIGYDLTILVGDEETFALTLDDSQVGFAAGAPAWNRSGDAISWVSEGRETGTEAVVWVLNTVTPATGAGVTVALPWVAEDGRITGLATRADGSFTAFLSGLDLAETDAVEFTDQGDLLQVTPVETGSRLGGYDPTGVYLIYVDGERTVRWIGGGRAGVLGQGYLFASW